MDSSVESDDGQSVENLSEEAEESISSTAPVPPSQKTVVDRRKLRSIIQQHLKTERVYEKLQEYVAEAMNDAAEEGDGHQVDEAQVMRALQERGIIDDVVQSLTKATDLASATGKPRTGGFLDLLTTPKEEKEENHGALSGIRVAGVAGVAPSNGGKGHRYLHLRVVAGRALVELLGDDEDTKGSMLHVHAHFRHQRFRCGPVPAAVNPQFNGSFVMDVQDENSSGPVDAGTLLTTAEPVHLVVTRTFENGKCVLMGSASFTWRKVLQTGFLSASVRIVGSGVEANHVPVGLLELRAQLLPMLKKEKITAARLEAQLEYETSKRQEAERLFFAYAKQWWREYLEARSVHSERLVKIYAQTERGDNVPVCSFVQPLHAPGLLDTPRQAARFVSLLGFEREESMRGKRSETWHLPHTFLSVGAGDCEDHAALLCSLLLGFHLDAFVCIGTDHRGPHVWVMTRVGNGSDGRCVFWESLTGARFGHPMGGDVEESRRHKYLTLDCAFNDKSFYANCQATSVVDALSFHFEDTSCWKPMTTEALSVLRRPCSLSLTPYVGDVAALEQRVASDLAKRITEQRVGLGLRTQWDPELGHLLTPALAAYELERVTGVVVGNEEFQLAVRRTVAEGNTFKAFPIQFNHTDSSRMMRSMSHSRVCRDVIETRGDRVRHGLRVRAYPYAEGAVALWVMLAVRYGWIG